MRYSYPAPVSGYLNSLPESGEQRPAAYIRVSTEGLVIDSGGVLEILDISKLETDIPIDEQLWQLSGLLPLVNGSIVIENTQVGNSGIVDLHIFIDSDDQWIVFLDNTVSAFKLQAEQQVRLSEDFEQEGQKKMQGK